MKNAVKYMPMHFVLIKNLVRDLIQFSPARSLLTFFLMLTRSVTSGIGLLLILPLLHLIGFSVSGNANNDVMEGVKSVFHYLHVPLNLVNILISYILIVSAVAFAAYAEQVVGTTLQQEYTYHLRTKLHRQLLQTPWSFFLKRKMSDLLYSLTTQVQGVSICNHQLLSLINNLFLTAAYTGLAFLISWPMTLLATVSAVFLLCLMLPLHRLTSTAGHRHLQQNQSIYQSITEQFSALKMIKGSGLEATFIDELLAIGSVLDYQNQRLTTMTARNRLLYTCGSVIVFSGLLYVALALLHVPLSSLLLLLIVFARLLPMVSSSQQTYQRILHQLPAYSDICRLLRDCMAEQGLVDETPSKPLLFQHSITLDKVGFHYAAPTTQAVLHNLSIQIKKNTTTAIVGPSGSGKSTLADLMVGLLIPTTGHINIDNQPLTSSNALAWRRSIAYVTQEVFLFNASIRDNLTLFSPNQTDTALWAALKLAAADFVADLDDGLDTLLGDRGVRLSGGERQRIALARALLMNPQVLVLDESTNALDRDNLKKIQSALNQLRGKITIIIISHQLEMSTFADQKIVLTEA